MALQTREPSRAVITSVGSALNGGVLSEALPVVVGTADAGDTVEIYDGVRFLGTTVATADGAWSFALSIALKTGSHRFACIAVDDENNRGASSVLLNVTLIFPVESPPAITGFLDHGGVSIAFNSATTESHPQTIGTGKPGDVVTVFDGSHVAGSTVVDSAGQWSLIPAIALSDGAHDIYAVASNAAGSQSAQSNHAGISIDTSTPDRAVITTVTDHFGPVQGPVDKGGSTDDVLPVISGTGKAGNIITLYDQTTLLGTTTVDSNGVWSIQPADPLGPSVHALVAIESTQAGTQGTPSATYSFFVDSQPAIVHSHAVLVQEPASDSNHIGNLLSHDAIEFSHAAGVTPAMPTFSVAQFSIDANIEHGMLKLSYADVLPSFGRDLIPHNDHQRPEGATKAESQTAGLAEAEWHQHGEDHAVSASHQAHAAIANPILLTLLIEAPVETAVH
jgi:hypothetical protein